ncbi:hypothetical protein LINGRAHAP2_LOCUS36528 [Linum grandiflorum]
MGCCVSKTNKLKNNPHFSSQELCHVQDKLVISQPPPPPPIRHYHSRRISPVFPLSPTHSSSSFSRRCESSSSSSSAALTSKDRSFSNEFLWSCLKENPHVLYLDSIKEYSAANKLAGDSPVPKQGNEKQSVSRSNSQKRIRSSSPSNLNRQKSFRRDYSDEIESAMSVIRSPSPSRRFANWESWSRGISSIESCNSNRVIGMKANAARSISPYVKRHELNSPSPAPASEVAMRRKKNRETLVHRISSKIDESAVTEAMARYEGECAAMEEDIDNPMISLDCFIFL